MAMLAVLLLTLLAVYQALYSVFGWPTPSDYLFGVQIVLAVFALRADLRPWFWGIALNFAILGFAVLVWSVVGLDIADVDAAAFDDFSTAHALQWRLSFRVVMPLLGGGLSSAAGKRVHEALSKNGKLASWLVTVSFATVFAFRYFAPELIRLSELSSETLGPTGAALLPVGLALAAVLFGSRHHTK